MNAFVCADFDNVCGSVVSSEKMSCCNTDVIIQEIKAGGVEGCLGLDQMYWGEPGGQIYEFWKCPCWGQPIDPKECLYCLALWICCPTCTSSRMLAHSEGQKCSIVPHILLCHFLPNFTVCCLRYNLRKQMYVPGNLCGDFVCIHFCPCCAQLQMIRAASKSHWDIFGPCELGIVAQPLTLLIS